MKPIFTRVPFANRENFIKFLANTTAYKNKIAFIEGNDTIPAEIWTNGKKYADCYTNSISDTIINALLNDSTILYNALSANPTVILDVLKENNIAPVAESDVVNIINQYIDSNSNGTPDWEDYVNEIYDNLWGDWEDN